MTQLVGAPAATPTSTSPAVAAAPGKPPASAEPAAPVTAPASARPLSTGSASSGPPGLSLAAATSSHAGADGWDDQLLDSLLDEPAKPAVRAPVGPRVPALMR
jgi:hypothetical protein